MAEETLALETVICKGKPYSLYAPMFWHVASAFGVPLYNNAFLHEGLLPTISLINQQEGLEDAVSWQSLKGKTDEKEIVWEQTRKEIDNHLPTRNGAFFLVDSEVSAKQISERWFPNQDRHILRVRIVAGSILFQADATWLDGKKEDWKAYARDYWMGKSTKSPMLEILVHGAVYFPDWRHPPFGIFAGVSKN